MHSLGQLPKYMIISSLIDVFMLIPYLTDNFFPHDWYLIHTISFQVVSKMYTIFAQDWWNKQWFRIGSIKSKHYFQNEIKNHHLICVCDWSCKYIIISKQISEILIKFNFGYHWIWLSNHRIFLMINRANT